MSSKKTTKKPSTRKPREYSRDDFKKLTPDQLEKLGYSRKSERFVNLKTKDIISKRQFAKLYFGITNEAKAKAIKSGTRPILDNAPKAARQGKIVKSAAKKAEKQAANPKKTTSYKKPVSIMALRDNKIRYTYRLPYLEIKSALSGDFESRLKLGARLESIINAHDNKALGRIVVQYIDTKGELTAFSLPLFMINDGADFILDETLDGLKEMLSRYAVTINQAGLNIFIKIYGV